MGRLGVVVVVAIEVEGRPWGGAGGELAAQTGWWQGGACRACAERECLRRGAGLTPHPRRSLQAVCTPCLPPPHLSQRIGAVAERGGPHQASQRLQDAKQRQVGQQHNAFLLAPAPQPLVLALPAEGVPAAGSRRGGGAAVGSGWLAGAGLRPGCAPSKHAWLMLPEAAACPLSCPPTGSCLPSPSQLLPSPPHHVLTHP